jgi:hypothetical protein
MAENFTWPIRFVWGPKSDSAHISYVNRWMFMAAKYLCPPICRRKLHPNWMLSILVLKLHGFRSKYELQRKGQTNSPRVYFLHVFCNISKPLSSEFSFISWRNERQFHDTNVLDAPDLRSSAHWPVFRGGWCAYISQVFSPMETTAVSVYFLRFKIVIPDNLYEWSAKSLKNKLRFRAWRHFSIRFVHCYPSPKTVANTTKKYFMLISIMNEVCQKGHLHYI